MASKKRKLKSDERVYCIRDTETGKLVYDMGSQGRNKKYWTSFAFAENAIRNYNKRTVNPRYGKLEIVEFQLEEIASYDV